MQSWNNVWDVIFSSRSWGKYPTEPLIRFVAKQYYGVPDRKKIHFLDLGCGYGSSTWYLCREGFRVTGIDGSKVVINQLHDRLEGEGYAADLDVGDIIHLPYPDQTFDCVIDINCLMCNDPTHTKRILDEVYRVLKGGGRLFSITPRTGCWGDGIGEPAGKNTYIDAPEGPFAHMGIVRFASEEDIRDLYSRFTIVNLDYHLHTVNNREHVLKFWNITAAKETM